MTTLRPWIASLALCLWLFACGDDASGDAWCEGCSLGEKMTPLEIDESIDCGSVREPAPWDEDADAGFDDAPLQCVRDALEDGVPFNLVVQLPGIDSTVQTGWVGREDGTFWVLTYDSHICGGDGCTSTCGPVVSRTLCMAPAQAETPRQLSGCESALGERESLCGPPGNAR
jgi:hypothetical protein